MNSQTGHIGFAVQSGKGTYAAAQFYSYYANDDIGLTPENIKPDAYIGGGRDLIEMYPGPAKVDGGITLDPRPDFAVLPMYAVLGALNTVAGLESGVYVSTVTPANTLPWISAEKKVSETYDVFKYTDMKVNSLTLSCEAGGQVTMQLDVRGMTESGSFTPTSPTYEQAEVWMWHSGTIEMNSTDICVTNFNMEINNNLVDDDYRICSTYGRGLGDLAEGQREISITLGIKPEDNDLYQKAVYGADNATSLGKTVYSCSGHFRFESVASIGLTAQKYYLDIVVPKMFFEPFKISPNGADVLAHDLNLVAAKSAGNDIMTVEIQNTVSDYTI